ncbi:SGNH/GDSL hydrolase family protein [Burkholderiaceae bacterium DAT-1]|nr:SGNH/GDSL hydrolase family protein [Burkholderiaceae bacterium DAT-1]
MHSRKAIMAGIILLGASHTFAIDNLTPTRPSHRFDRIVSNSGPLSAEEVVSNHTQMASDSLTHPFGTQASNTYTYLRCYYHTSDDWTQPATDYVWGQTASGSYYKLSGYWYSAGVIGNLFYTTTSQADIRSACQSTLAQKGIRQPLAAYFVANHALSYNYTVWTNDSTPQSGKINRIVAFGDSLSDAQNMYNESNWILPSQRAYYIGRFTNGANWVEYLGNNLGLTVYNWSVGGAGVNREELIIPGVEEQVDSWKQYMNQAVNYSASHTLFTMLIGANDLVNYGRNVAHVIRGESAALEKLIDAGAKHILVLTLPDVSKAPVFKLRNDGSTIQAQIVDLRNQLIIAVANLQARYASRGVNIQVFDTYTLLNDVIANPSTYGVSNTTESCLDINSTSAFNYTTAQHPRPGCTSTSVANYLFWDTLHPTTRTHEVLGSKVANFVNSQFAPALGK